MKISVAEVKIMNNNLIANPEDMNMKLIEISLGIQQNNL